MDIFSFIKSRVAIFDVVSEYASLKKAGMYWKGHCPFHSEKTASFTVSPHKEIFYCFGCNSGGDVISFIEKVENCSAFEAAQQLIDRYQIAIPKELASTIDHSSQNEHKNIHELMCTTTAQWCHQNLLKNHTALSYVKKRGISDATIKQFGIGYFPGGLASIKNFIHFLSTYNILSGDLIDAHILLEGKNVLFSPFEERIIFPIKDHLGRFCAFGGRTFKPTDERAKYYNSRESTFFNKGSMLFGLDTAKKAIQHTKTAFLVEGYLDCIMMVQYGFGNTVATLGTACTLEHLKMLTRYAQTLIFVYDGDSAGQQAIIRLAELCWQVNVELQVIQLPAAEDPASFLQKGNNLHSLIANAKDFFDFFTETLGTNFTQKSLSEKLTIARKFIETIQRIEDGLKRDILLQRASKVFNIPFESLREELDVSIRKNSTAQSAPNNPDRISHSGGRHEKTAQESQPLHFDASSMGQEVRLEKKIVSAILTNAQLLNQDNEEFLLEYLPISLRGILKRLKQFKDENLAYDFMQFYEKLGEGEKLEVIKIVLEDGEDVEEKAFEGLVLQFYKKHWKVIVTAVKTKLAHASKEADGDKVAKILDDFATLKKKLLTKVL
jgi:DNA primase